MDYTKILKRAWDNVWSYRALWVFGVLLAITTTNGFLLAQDYNQDGNNPMRNSIRLTEHMYFNFPGEGVRIDLSTPGEPMIDFDPDLVDLPAISIGRVAEETIGNIWAIFYTAAAVLILVVVAGAIFRYTSEAALIRMVDETEDSGQKLSVGQGLRLGWSRTAWRLFLIDLAIFLPLFLAFILLFTLSISPMMLWLSGSVGAGVFGTALSVGLLFIYGMLVFAIVVALSPLMPLFRMVCSVEGVGVRASIRQGLRLISRHFVEVIVVWLIWIGTRLAWMLALIPIFILLLPVTLLFILAGTVMVGTPAAVLGGLLSTGMAGIAPWIISLIIFLPLFFMVAFAPLYFLSGLVEVFKTSTWTLAYRQLRVLESQAEKSPTAPSEKVIPATQAAG